MRDRALEEIFSIVTRFPQREFEIRRRCMDDADFKSICANYEEAAAALRHWQKVGKEGDRRVKDYADIIGELEAEILGQLERPSSSH
jgi:hypothetical protein